MGERAVAGAVARVHNAGRHPEWLPQHRRKVGPGLRTLVAMAIMPLTIFGTVALGIAAGHAAIAVFLRSFGPQKRPEQAPATTAIPALTGD